MGWLSDWRRRRVLERHRIDDALWRARSACPSSGLSAERRSG